MQLYIKSAIFICCVVGYPAPLTPLVVEEALPLTSNLTALVEKKVLTTDDGPCSSLACAECLDYVSSDGNYICGFSSCGCDLAVDISPITCSDHLFDSSDCPAPTYFNIGLNSKKSPVGQTCANTLGLNPVTDKVTCKTASDSLDFNDPSVGSSSSETRPPYCYTKTTSVYFKAQKYIKFTEKADSSRPEICVVDQNIFYDPSFEAIPCPKYDADNPDTTTAGVHDAIARDANDQPCSKLNYILGEIDGFFQTIKSSKTKTGFTAELGTATALESLKINANLLRECYGLGVVYKGFSFSQESSQSSVIDELRCFRANIVSSAALTTTWAGSTPYPASNCFDGDIETMCHGNNQGSGDTLTATVTGYVEKIKITNRQHICVGCQDRWLGGIVKFDGTEIGTITENMVQEFIIANPNRGAHTFSLEITGGYLNIAEVEFFGYDNPTN